MAAPAPDRAALRLAMRRRLRIEPGHHPNLRPRDAATLLIIDHSGAQPRVLMGKRHEAHRFMPGKFVFPGGRVEPQDYLATVGGAMPHRMRQRLLRHIKGAAHPQRAYALAHAALRETQEETGVVIQRDVHGALSLDFRHFNFLARAITPPRRPKRFDTRFFTISAEHITDRLDIVDGEFTAIEWPTLTEARKLDLPSITQTILDELDERLHQGTLQDAEQPVPFYFMRGACFHRKLL